MRTAPDPMASERHQLEQFLDFHRATLVQKCGDLSPEQVATAPFASNLSLQGLIRHMARVERWWFRSFMREMRLPPLYISKENPDGDFDGVRPGTWADDLATYQTEVAAARDAAKGLPLDHSRDDISVRWVYLHMIAEYARHNGHADLIREQLDGRTGV